MASRRPLGPIARLVVRALVPARFREEVEGDLEERRAEVADRAGGWAARRWLAWQLLALVAWPLRRRAPTGHDPIASAAGGGGSGWGLDVRLGLRALRFRAGTSLVVIATVGLAVGATTSVYTVVDGVLLRPLPYPDSDRLVRVWQTKEDWFDSPNSQLRAFANRFPVSVPTFMDWTRADLGFEALGAYSSRAVVHHDADAATVLGAQMVTSGFFEALRIQPVLGRRILPADDEPGATPVVVLGEELWDRRFATSPTVLGSTLRLDGISHEVIGVMPRSFQGPGYRAELWISFDEESKADERDSQWLSVLGRLAEGVSVGMAAQRLEVFQDGLRTTYPDAHGDVGSRLESLLDSVVGDVRTTLWFLLSAVGLVLLVATLNIANVLGVLGLTRRRELAVKAALGAGSGRLVRGLFIENAVLAGLGGLLGVALAWLSLPLLLRTVPTDLPRYESIEMSWGVLAFGLAVAVVTTLVVGVLPAMQASGTQPREMMRSSSRGATGGRAGRRVRAALVSAEVALAFVLLVAAGLLGNSFVRLWSVERGFETQGLAVLMVVPNPLEYPEAEDRERFTLELHDRLAAIPGVEVSATNQVPLSGSMSTTTYEIERLEGEPDEVNVVISVGLPNYLELMGIPLVDGRPFAPGITSDGPRVAIANEALARTAWPDESPVGKRLRTGPDAPWVEIVGVAADVRHQSLSLDAEPKLYVPATQSGRAVNRWVLRIRGDLASSVEQARAAVEAQSPSTPVRGIEILEEWIADSVAVPRFRTFFVVGLAALAGLLALIGVYSVVTFAVSQRTREIGVRMALGARSEGVVREVVRSGLTLALVGVAVGLVIAVLASRLLADFLFDIAPTDVATFASIALAITVVSGLASYLPARRAAAVDPMTVLNSE